jgi:CRP-like cAMP-binding protein
MRAFDQQQRFAGRPVDDRGALSLGSARRFTAGQQLLANGGPPSHAALITRGLVKVTAAVPSDRWAQDTIGIMLSIRGPGDFVGEEAAVLGDPPDGYLHHGGIKIIKSVALTDGSARVFPTWQLRRLLEHQPHILRAVTEGLCRRLADAEARIASAASDSAPRRLARLLCELERHGYPDEARGGTRLPVKFSQTDFASWIGSSLATVDSALRNWRYRGIISTGYRTIVVRDLELLARIAGVQVSRRTWNWPSGVQISATTT